MGRYHFTLEVILVPQAPCEAGGANQERSRTGPSVVKIDKQAPEVNDEDARDSFWLSLRRIR